MIFDEKSYLFLGVRKGIYGEFTAYFFDKLCLGRIGKDEITELIRRDFMLYREGQYWEYLSGLTSHDGGSEDPPCEALKMNLYESRSIIRESTTIVCGKMQDLSMKPLYSETLEEF